MDHTIPGVQAIGSTDLATQTAAREDAARGQENTLAAELPVQQDDEQVGEPPIRSDEQLATELPAREAGSETILLVEDQAELRTALGRILAGNEMLVCSAAILG